jgi:hypothetical protein
MKIKSMSSYFLKSIVCTKEVVTSKPVSKPFNILIVNECYQPTLLPLSSLLVRTRVEQIANTP